MTATIVRFLTALQMNHRQYIRRRLNLVLLLVVPGFFVTVVFFAFPQQLSPIQLYENGIRLSLITTRRSYAGIFQALEVACTLAGLTGVFMILNAMKADRRLVLSGYRPFEIVAARIAQLISVAVFVSLVATVCTAANFWSGRARYSGPPARGTALRARPDPIDPLNLQPSVPARQVTQVEFTRRTFGGVFLAICLGAGIYAAAGVFVGALLRRQLEGSYVMFAMPFTDIVILNTPVFSRAIGTWWVTLTPAYHPSRLLEAAAFTEGYPMRSLVGAVCVLAIMSSFAMLAFRRFVRA